MHQKEQFLGMSDDLLSYSFVRAFHALKKHGSILKEQFQQEANIHMNIVKDWKGRYLPY
jgi:hypothetical protein